MKWHFFCHRLFNSSVQVRDGGIVLHLKTGSVGLLKFPNPKLQITNKSQIPIFNDRNRLDLNNQINEIFPELKFLSFNIIKGVLNFGHWNLFVICDLYFGSFEILQNSELQ